MVTEKEIQGKHFDPEYDIFDPGHDIRIYLTLSIYLTLGIK